jgi:hypothetical protein
VLRAYDFVRTVLREINRGLSEADTQRDYGFVQLIRQFPCGSQGLKRCLLDLAFAFFDED